MMKGNHVVALQVSTDVYESLKEKFADVVEFAPPVIVAGGAESAHAPGTAKNMMQTLVLTTAVLTTATAATELATAIKDLVSGGEENVQIVDPRSGEQRVEITVSTSSEEILKALNAE